MFFLVRLQSTFENSMPSGRMSETIARPMVVWTRFS